MKENYSPKNFGKRLWDLLDKKGISQTTLAAHLRVVDLIYAW